MRIQNILGLHLTLSLNRTLSVQCSNLTRHRVIDLKLLDLSCLNRFTASTNVIVEITEIDLTSFVTDQGIRIVPCFKVKPRLTAWQRRNNISPTDHNTFRICILEQDKNRDSCKQTSGRRTFQFRHGSSKVQQPPLMTTTPATTSTAGTVTSPGQHVRCLLGQRSSNQHQCRTQHWQQHSGRGGVTSPLRRWRQRWL